MYYEEIESSMLLGCLVTSQRSSTEHSTNNTTRFAWMEGCHGRNESRAWAGGLLALVVAMNLSAIV